MTGETAVTTMTGITAAAGHGELARTAGMGARTAGALARSGDAMVRTAGVVVRTGDAVAGAAGRGRAALVGAAAVTAGLVGLAGVSWAGLVHQIHETSTLLDAASKAARARPGVLTEGQGFTWQAVLLHGDGVYMPDGTGPLERAPDDPAGGPRTLTLTMLGDSLSVGYGCATIAGLPGVALARLVAARLGRPVRVATHGVMGSGAADLERQSAEALPDRPDVAVIVVGSNDVRDHIPPRRSAARLRRTVSTLRADGIPVVVGTCPDLGVITTIPQPLRRVVSLWSRRLGLLQGRAVAAAGGVPVPIGRIVSPDFYGRPDLFYADGVHPSEPGYAKAVAALLPEVIAALR